MRPLFQIFARIKIDDVEANKKLGNIEEKAKKTHDVVSTKLANAAKHFEKFGKGTEKIGDKITSHVTKPAIAAGSAVVGITLMKGWKRMTAIDTAKAKLKGLGYSANEVKIIMNNALESVQGTAFGLDSAATVATAAVATGVKHGAELERYLKSIADVATFTGGSMEEIGLVFNKVMAQGKMQGDEAMQLAERGVPILEWIGKVTGKTQEELKEMQHDGEITSAIFLDAIQAGSDGLAKIGDKTIRGALQNVGSAVSRIGQNFLGTADDADTFAGQLLPVIHELKDGLRPIEEKAKALGKIFGEVFKSIIGYFKNGKVEMDGLSPAAQMVMSYLKPLLETISTVAKAFNKLGPRGKAAFVMTALGIGPTTKAIGLFTRGIGKTIGAVDKSVKGFKKARDTIKKMKDSTALLRTEVSLLNKVQSASNKAQKLYNGSVKAAQKLWNGSRTAATKLAAKMKALVSMNTLLRAKTIALSVAQKAAAGAQKLLNLVMSANPIFLIVTAIGALVAAFVILWNKSEAFRNFWKNLWDGIKQYTTVIFNAIKEVITVVWEAIKVVVTTYINTVSTIIRTVLNVIKTVWTTVWTAIKTTVETVWNVISGIVTTVTGAVSSVISTTWNGIKSVTSETWSAISTAVSEKAQAISKGVSETWGSIKRKTSETWTKIKDSISKPITAAYEKVRDGINKIKGMFNFEFKWPHLPMPHFSFSGSMNPLKWAEEGVPSIGVEWYAKGGIMEKPTAFGRNGDNLMVGGEAGPEAIAPIDKLQSYVKNAVEEARGSDDVDKKLDKLIGLISELIGIMKQTKIVMDTGALVGALAPKMDNALGAAAIGRRRG